MTGVSEETMQALKEVTRQGLLHTWTAAILDQPDEIIGPMLDAIIDTMAVQATDHPYWGHCWQCTPHVCDTCGQTFFASSQTHPGRFCSTGCRR